MPARESHRFRTCISPALLKLEWFKQDAGRFSKLVADNAHLVLDRRVRLQPKTNNTSYNALGLIRYHNADYGSVYQKPLCVVPTIDPIVVPPSRCHANWIGWKTLARAISLSGCKRMRARSITCIKTGGLHLLP